MTRAVIYARYSSDNQRDASIEDQVRQCRARIDQEEWQLAEIYSDHAISGPTTLRPGYQRMLETLRPLGADPRVGTVIAWKLVRKTKALAESEGFEPSVRLGVQRFSSSKILMLTSAGL
jgi:DNA invertase Pin-like site-specific DNA recombinase